MPKITNTRTIELEIDGTVHKMTLAELQALYDEIAKVDGIDKHSPKIPWYQPERPLRDRDWPWTQPGWTPKPPVISRQFPNDNKFILHNDS